MLASILGLILAILVNLVSSIIYDWLKDRHYDEKMPHSKKIGRGTLCVILISRSHFLTAKSVQNLVTLSVLVALLLMY